MYPWLHLGPYTLSTYSLLFLCAYTVGGIVTYYEAKRQHRATEAILRVALGALAGGLVGAKERFNHINYPTGDVFALALPLAQAIGRLGNLLGGDPFGLPSNLPWAITQYGVRRQPSALYEMLLDLLLFTVIWRMRDKMPRAGDLFKLYVIGYCSFRFLVDFTRADPRVFLGFTLVQVLYALTIVGFSYSLWNSYRESRAVKTVPDARATETI
jgi:phosphatidylglycerol:prolipoprotein diacylglycerol transferase